MSERKIRCSKPCGGTVARTLEDAWLQFVSGRAIDGAMNTTGDGRPLNHVLAITEADELAPSMHAVCMKCGRPHALVDVLRTWRRMKLENRASNNIPHRP